MRNLILALTLVFTALQAAPAMAYNDWYQQGYADGALTTESSCQTRNQSTIYTLSMENAELRRQLAVLRTVNVPPRTVPGKTAAIDSNSRPLDAALIRDRLYGDD